MAEALYKVDFEIFGYQQNNRKVKYENFISRKCTRIHRCESIGGTGVPRQLKKKGNEANEGEKMKTEISLNHAYG